MKEKRRELVGRERKVGERKKEMYYKAKVNEQWRGEEKCKI